MKKQVLLVLFVLTAAWGSAQSLSKVNFKKFTRVVIADPGALYSTFDLMGHMDAIEQLSNVLGSESNMKIAVSLANESAWPDGLKLLDERINARDKIKQLVAVRILDFEGFTLVAIPAKMNKKSPIPVPFDFFMIYAKEGIGAFVK